MHILGVFFRYKKNEGLEIFYPKKVVEIKLLLN